MKLITDYTVGNVSNWGPAIQRAIDDLSDKANPKKSGGVIHFPKGIYTARTPVSMRCPNVTFAGEGGPRSFACQIDWRGEGDGALFQMAGDSYGFNAQNINFRSRVKGGTAFRFDEPGGYRRGFRFERCGIAYFRRAFEFLGPGGGWGQLAVLDSDVIYNGQILDATNGYLNEWQFRGCFLEKNGLASEGWDPAYALDLLGTDNGALYGCVLEKQPRAIRVRKSQGLRMEGCRLEGNAGIGGSTDPVCLFEKCNGVWIQIFNRVLKAENAPTAPPHVQLINCRDEHVEPMAGGVRIWRKWEPRY